MHNETGEQVFRIPGPKEGKSLFLRLLPTEQPKSAKSRAVLYVHGATFPSALSIAYRFGGRSWRDELCAAGFDVWGLDFYGFGGSDRYSEMEQPADQHAPLCTALDAAEQLERAVDFILTHQQINSVSLISHSWGAMPCGILAAKHPAVVDRWVLFAPITKRTARRYETPAALPAWRLISAEDQWNRFVEDVPEHEPPVLYLANAKHLKPILESIDGFIDNERFESQSRKDWLLSHSTWRDEKSVVRWRTTGAHHEIQEQGRSGIFSDYHLRVGEVIADSTPPTGIRILEQRLDETEVGVAKYATLTEIEPEQKAALSPKDGLIPAHLGLDIPNSAVVAHDLFTSINNPGKLTMLVSWKTANEARAFSPKPFAGVARLRHRVVRVVRDYGMFDRREAPQYYPDVAQSPPL